MIGCRLGVRIDLKEGRFGSKGTRKDGFYWGGLLFGLLNRLGTDGLAWPGVGAYKR